MVEQSPNVPVTWQFKFPMFLSGTDDVAWNWNNRIWVILEPYANVPAVSV